MNDKRFEAKVSIARNMTAHDAWYVADNKKKGANVTIELINKYLTQMRTPTRFTTHRHAVLIASVANHEDESNLRWWEWVVLVALIALIVWLGSVVLA